MFGNCFSVFQSSLFSFLLTFSLFVQLVLVFGCAEPKYVSDKSADSSGPLKQETLADCKNSFSISEVCLTWYWEKKPVANDEGSLIFKTYKLNVFDKTPVEVNMDSMPKLVLWMPSMGHGSTPTEIAQLDVGTYRASKVRFIMPGEWELKFQIEKGSESPDELAIKITF